MPQPTASHPTASHPTASYTLPRATEVQSRPRPDWSFHRTTAVSRLFAWNAGGRRMGTRSECRGAARPGTRSPFVFVVVSTTVCTTRKQHLVRLVSRTRRSWARRRAFSSYRCQLTMMVRGGTSVMSKPLSRSFARQYRMHASMLYRGVRVQRPAPCTSTTLCPGCASPCGGSAGGRAPGPCCRRRCAGVPCGAWGPAGR